MRAPLSHSTEYPRRCPKSPDLLPFPHARPVDRTDLPRSGTGEADKERSCSSTRRVFVCYWWQPSQIPGFFRKFLAPYLSQRPWGHDLTASVPDLCRDLTRSSLEQASPSRIRNRTPVEARHVMSLLVADRHPELSHRLFPTAWYIAPNQTGEA